MATTRRTAQGACGTDPEPGQLSFRPPAHGADRRKVMNLDRLDRVGQVKAEDGAVEEQLGLNSTLQVLGPAEAVLFSLEAQVGIRDLLSLQNSRHRLRLGGRDHRGLD